MQEIQARFQTAADEAQKLAKRPGNDVLLQLYALYKQATVGDATGARPGFMDMTGRAKFDAWAKVKGKSVEDAMQEYIAFVERLKGTA